MELQWYPGHMTKAKRAMLEDIKLVDLVIEVCDARIPLSSRNPDIDDIAGSKKRIIILNKSDLADERVTSEFSEYFKQKGIFAVPMDARTREGIRAVTDAIQTVCREKMERDLKRGIKNRPVRAMVVGIPNSGKSTFINSFCRKASAKTGNKPGVTKGKQWIHVDKTLDLLDTPGILWPKFSDKSVGINLAICGSIKDDIINLEELALILLEKLAESHEELLLQKYDIKGDDRIEWLSQIAVSRGCIKSGGEVDISKAAACVLDDFRKGAIGRITLERV
ncbi:MAG: ribosome biogenesis GTPase YlqF [Lachnospiraceae bacterium]|nr:ribosome biogenesis GTPase YlqF [Lachnospiraceae bacterium]